MKLGLLGSVLLCGYAMSTAGVTACDFDQPTGACRGSISIDSVSGSKGSYSAELTVKSSAGSCSKVEYYLDNTPQVTVIRNAGSESESVFGTRPITRKSLAVKKCTSYAKSKGSGGNDKQAAGPKFFEGRWQGSVGMLLIRATLVLDLSVDGNRVTGTATAPHNGETYSIDGTVTGGVLSYTYAQPIGGAPATVRITKKSANSISYAGSGDGITLSGTLQRF
ncbi:hypothetical protein J2Z31_001741 [Sinorhizobium kostiense]|uniref:Uncharacterized protein n=1 Tax=Sinorhizobium kostiense TaxID=76747 RepID=A0ABS4QXP0_9HYPH|nr:hypothetical protein [Sinorhizobium kostiense]MBP2235249.1 hypothetical protein [Sinorhizobium kostiense]